MKKIKLLLTAAVLLGITAASKAQVPNYVPSNGLVGWWPFNGNANDESGNGNNCSIINGPSLGVDRFGNSNSAFLLDGIDDWIQTNNSFLHTDMPHTISIWWQTTDSSKTNQTLFNTNPHTLENLAFHYSSSNPNPPYGIAYGMGDGIGGSSSSWNIMHPDNGQIPMYGSFNSWHNCVWVKDSTYKWQFFIDGILRSSFSSIINTGSQIANLRFGAENNGFPTGGANFKGYLDDIAIWNRALTQQEITNLYTAATPPPPCNPLAGNLMNGLVGYWPFCGNANDESGNGNNGTVNGATLTSDRFGNANGAFAFNGVSDYIEVINDSTLNNPSISISAWFNANDFGLASQLNQGMIVSKHQPPGWGASYELAVNSINGNNVWATFSINGNKWVSTQNSLTQNNWTYVVYTHDNNNAKMYINGLMVDSLNIVGGLSANSLPMWFGARPNAGSNSAHFFGKLDDIAIWNRALSPSEISQLYNQNICYQTITVTDTLLINVNLSGLNPVTYQNTIKVFPNPAGDHVTINFGSNYANLNGYSIKIDNTLSQTVFTSPVQQNSAYIDLNTWTGVGLYFIYLLDAQGHVVDVRKIVLQ